MGWKGPLYLAVPLLLSGCNIASYAVHNLVNEPAQQINRVKLHQRMNAEARAAWKAECARRPAGTYSGAYADGYIDGYTDHLDNGGTPAQPVAPPPRYRRHANDFTAAGQAAQKDYLVGFQHGAETAAAGGNRENIVVAINLPPPPPERPLNINCVPAPPNGPEPPPMLPPLAPGPVGSAPAVPPRAAPLPSVPKATQSVRPASLGLPQAAEAATAGSGGIQPAGHSAPAVIGRVP